VTNNRGDLARPGLTWQRHLDEAGYETALYGKYLNSWLNRRRRDPIPHFDHSWQGYNRNHAKDALKAEGFLAERAVGFLERAERDDPRPWAMVLATRSPHDPYAIRTASDATSAASSPDRACTTTSATSPPSCAGRLMSRLGSDTAPRCHRPATSTPASSAS
jgi:Sulfatase